MKTRMKLNLRFLLCVLIGAAVLGVSVHFVHGYQVKRNAKALLLQADAAKEEADKAKEEAAKAKDDKDAAKAKECHAQERKFRLKELQYLVRYIGLAPKDIDAQARHGEALDEEGKTTQNPRTRLEAFVELERVLFRDSSRDKIRRRQVDTAIYFRRFGDALTHLEVLLSAAPKDAELLRLQGLCKAGNNDFVNAVEDYKKASEINPELISNYLSLALLYRDRLKQPEEANKQMEELVKKGKPEFRAFLTRAEYYLQYEAKDPNKLEQAKKDVEWAHKLEPNEPDVVLAAAEVERAQGHVDEARKTLHQGIKSHPRDARLYYALVSLEAREDNLKEALKLARQGEKELRDLPEDAPGKSDLLHILADLLVQSGELKEAQTIIAQLDKIPSFPKPFLEYLRASILVRENRWSEASKLLDDVHPKLSRLPNLQAQALTLLGQCHQQLGNPDQALVAYREARQLDPLSAAIRYRLGALHLAQGRTAEALAEYGTIKADTKKTAGMHLIMARTWIAHNQKLPRENRKLDGAQRELDLAEKENAEAVELPIMRAQLILLDDPKKLAEARQLIATAREKHPDEAAYWIAEAQLSTPTEAGRLLTEAQRRPKLAENVDLRLAQLRLLMQAPAEKTPEQQKRAVEKQRKVLAKTEEEAKKLAAETDRSSLFSGLAEAYMSLGDTAEAERLWTEVAQKQPKNLGVRLVLFDLALLKKNTKTIDRLLEELHGIEGEDGVYWRYAKASRLLQEVGPIEKGKLTDSNRRQLGDARQLLIEAARLRPSWARITTLEARIDEFEDKDSAAIEKYQHALDQGERRPEIVRKAVQLMFEKGNAADAVKEVHKLLDQGDTLLAAGLGKLAAASLLTDPESNKGDVKRALLFASSAVRPDSKEYKDHLWLGRVQWAAGELDKAEKSLRNACELAGNAPDTWMALVAFLASTGHKKEAEQAIGQATKKLTAKEAPLALAVCYENVGDLKKAEEKYRAAMQAAPEDVFPRRLLTAFYLKRGQLGEAEQLLRALLAREDKLSDDEGMWARRSLAAVLASNRGRSQFEKALELVKGNLQKDPSSRADKHAKAMLLATRISTRQDAIGLFEELAQSSPLPANEQFILVQLYMAERDWERAQARMLILLSRPDGKNPAYEADYARGLLDHGNIGQAESLLRKLKTTLPAGAPLAREIEARVHQARQRDGEAIRVIGDYADRKDGDPLRAAGLLKALAAKCAARDRKLPAAEKNKARNLYLDAAEDLYRKHVKQTNKPDRFLILAEFLASRQQTAAALDLCAEAQRNKAAADAVAPVIAITLRYAVSPKEHSRRVEEWLKDMADKNPDSAPVRISLADLYDLQDRFTDAEKMYRAALAKDPANVVALNNLAWLLAFKGSSARDEALAAINKAMASVGEGPELLDTRGVIYLMMGRSDRAVQDLQLVVARAPNPNHYFHLARALAAANQWKEAAKMLSEAERLGFDVQQLHSLERQFGKRLLDELHDRGAKLTRNP